MQNEPKKISQHPQFPDVDRFLKIKNVFDNYDAIVQNATVTNSTKSQSESTDSGIQIIT